MANKADLTRKEYAAEARLHPGTVLRHLKLGIIPGAYKVGKQWRIPNPPKKPKREAD